MTVYEEILEELRLIRIAVETLLQLREPPAERCGHPDKEPGDHG